MGYSTRYSLEVDPKFNEEFENFCESSDLECKPYEKPNFWSALINGEMDACKWYDHEQHMVELSKKFPEILFTLTGVGEEGGDLWKKYFKGGKMQVALAKIVYDEFDESKLKRVKKQ